MTEVQQRQPELRTERLRLRRLRPADAPLLALYAGDARVARMTRSIPHPYPPGAAEAMIKRACSPEAVAMTWALDAGAEDENGVIGLIALKPDSAAAAEVQYWVAPAFWNAGFAGEAVEAVAAYAAARGVKTLAAEAFQDNLASARVLTRAGFALNGAGEAHCLARGGCVPTFRYRRVLDERR